MPREERGPRRKRGQRLGSRFLLRIEPSEHGRKHLVDDGTHGYPAKLVDPDEAREPAQLQVSARKAMVEDQPQAVWIPEVQGGANAIHRRVDVQRVLQVEQIEQVALRDAQNLGSP